MGDLKRRALITGITGQDGSYLAELLLERGYEVTGLVRGGQKRSLGSSEHLRERLRLLAWDLRDRPSLLRAIDQVRPNELYHLAAPSFIPSSWRTPAQIFSEVTGSTAWVFEIVREIDPEIRVFVACSGAIFGDVHESPQNELTPCLPASPYAAAKLASHQLTGMMRTHDGLFACSGILFNHESERRPERFVTRRIARAAAAISLGLQDELTLGDLDAVRDWSFAGDVMRGAWLMLQGDQPADYVLASGVGRTVAELAHTAFECVGLQAKRHLRIDPDLVRAPEKAPSVGDPNKAQTQMGWRPEVSFEDLIARMVHADLRGLEAQRSKA
jgi:GDPmannose 4,6-dehydratase